MTLTNENWLPELGKDIIKRKSLYPESDRIENLNKTNWLLILRNDILHRQSLYPNSEALFDLTSSNWIIKLRDDIVSRGSLYPNETPPIDPRLDGLQLEGIGMSPTFDPDTFDYTAGTASASTTKLFIVVDPALTVVSYFDNLPYSLGNEASLSEGLNTFRVEVSNSIQDKVVYSVSVLYTPPSTKLSSLSFSNATLNEEFDPIKTQYTANVNGGQTQGMATLNTESPTATCAVNLNGSGMPLSGVGPYTAAILFNKAENTFDVEVSNGTAPKTVYNVVVTR